MKNYLILFVLMFSVLSCNPPMNCIDPDCGSSPIDFQLEANVNDTSSLIRLGDTLVFKIQVPDTIDTNNGLYLVEAIDAKNSLVSIDYSFIDTIFDTGVGELELLNETIQFKKGGLKKSNSMTFYFDENSRTMEFFLIPSKRGKYYIASSIQSSRFVFKEKGNDWMLAMSKLDLDVENYHHDLYLSWIPDLVERVATSHALSDRKRAGSFLYAFEVK